MSEAKDLLVTDIKTTTDDIGLNTCDENCIIKNAAYLKYAIENDTELNKENFAFSTPVQLCVESESKKKLVGLKLICKQKAYVGETVAIKIVAANLGNVGLTGLFVKDSLPVSLAYLDEATVEVFNQNGDYVKPIGADVYTVSDTTPPMSNNVVLTLVKAITPIPLPYTLPAGWFAVFTFKVKVLAKGSIKNSATVGAIGVAEDPSNEIEVIGHILGLTITKSIKGVIPGKDYVVKCNDPVTFILKVSNLATNTLKPTSFTIVDMFESEFNYTGIKITLDGGTTDISGQFLITTPTVANFNTLTIKSDKFPGLNTGHYIEVEVSGKIVCCKNC